MMNKIILTTLLVALSFNLLAQWINNGNYLSTTTDNVGIGTSTPQGPLVINKVPSSGYAHLFLGDPTSSSGQASSKLTFAGTGIQHAGFVWVPNTANNYGDGKLQLAFGGNQDPLLNNTKITFQSNGNVGIGTTNPEYKFDIDAGALPLYKRAVVIRSDINMNSSPYTQTLGLWGLDPNGSSSIGFGQNSHGVIRGVYMGSHANGKLEFLTREGTSPPSTKMTILNNGNVGIGTNNPSSILHLENAAPVITAKATNQGSGLRFNVIDQNSDLFRLQKDGITQWTMKSNGSVGIGTSTTGSHKLAVEGSIGAREVKVEASGWSDFVFQDGYKLKPLNEVEEFISTNRHLPDVPNESEVLENGINLGDMNARLLQKIEELTLYLIEQNKKLEILIAQNKAQQKEIEVLKKKI